VTIPPPSLPNYGNRDPGYPAYPRGLSTPRDQEPGGEPVRIGALPFLAVLFAFCAPVIGLVCGVIAVIQTREPGRGSRVVAWVGMILSLVSTVALVIWTINYFGETPVGLQPR
jgi:hypothetical protein